MTQFRLQYCATAKDDPLMEFTSPLPLPVPRNGETVHLFALDGVEIVGRVERVEWAYTVKGGESFKFNAKDEYLEERIEAEETVRMFVTAKVWLVLAPTRA